MKPGASVKPWRRRKLIVSKIFQLRLIALSLSYVILALLAVAVTLFIPLMLEIGETSSRSSAATEVASQVLYLHSKFWLPALLSLAVVALHSLWTSHRIAGPLYRLRIVLDGVRQGILPREARTRKGDFFAEEILTTNQMLEALRENIGEVLEASRCLQQAISALRTNLPHASRDQISLLLEALQERGDSIEQKAAFFKIGK